MHKIISRWLGIASLLLAICAITCFLLLIYIVITYTRAGREVPTPTVERVLNIGFVLHFTFSIAAFLPALLRIYSGLSNRGHLALNRDFWCAIVGFLISLPFVVCETL